MKLALFDLDGTITTRDTFIDFLMFREGLSGVAMGFLRISDAIVRFYLGKLRNDQLKEKAVTVFWKGVRVAELQDDGKKYARDRLPRLVRSKAMEKIRWHRDEGHRVIVVSASMDTWLGPWCEAQHLELISTRLEVVDGKLTGRLETPNCYGKEKVRRIQDVLNIEDYEYIYAYGDSRGDKEMLGLAHEAHFKPFR